MTRTRDDLATEAFPLIAIAARKFRLPAGINTDDLESAGNQALTEALAHYDPAQGPWKRFAYACIKTAMRNVLRHARTRRRATLCSVDDQGNELPPPVDVRSADPAKITEVRELVSRPKRNLSVRQLEQSLPSPAAVADQVTKLRSAMFGSINESDVRVMMEAVMAKAQAGDLKAAKLLMDLLAPGRSGVTVNQQAIVVQHGDLT